jgi:hypothetical protein
MGILKEFYNFMKGNGCSEKHINNNLKAIMNFDSSLDPNISFLEIRRIKYWTFLDSNIKTTSEDPDRECITTWNHYLNR